MITDREGLAAYLGQEVEGRATFTDQRKREGPQPPLHLILHVRFQQVYVQHLWVTLPRNAGLTPGQRFAFRGVVVRYLRPDTRESCTISRIEILGEKPR